MKKRLLCTILILVMMFGATVPSYAEAWTSQEADIVTKGVTNILAQVLQISSKLGTIDSSGKSVLDNILISINQLAGWLVPDGARPSSAATLLDSVIVLTNYAMNHLPDISVISGYVGSWMSQNNNYLSTLVLALSHQYISSQSDLILKAHSQLGNASDPNYLDGLYYIKLPSSNGLVTSTPILWGNGTPLGNVALLIKSLIDNNAQIYQYRWNADLTDYNAQLGVWEFDTLTQTAWQPTSAINGLYHYLAYVQRDVARLTYVLANQQDIDTRESIKESGIEDLKTQLYDKDNGGMQLNDMTDTLGLGSDAKSAFDLGSVDKSNAFSFTDDEGWGFWSKAVENDMLNIPQTRMLKTNIQEPETPLYDEKMQAFWEGIGIKDGE